MKEWSLQVRIPPYISTKSCLGRFLEQVHRNNENVLFMFILTFPFLNRPSLCETAALGEGKIIAGG